MPQELNNLLEVCLHKIIIMTDSEDCLIVVSEPHKVKFPKTFDHFPSNLHLEFIKHIYKQMDNEKFKDGILINERNSEQFAFVKFPISFRE